MMKVLLIDRSTFLLLYTRIVSWTLHKLNPSLLPYLWLAI